MEWKSNEYLRRAGRYCKAVREYNNITIEEFANLLDLPVRKIWDFECGLSNKMNLFMVYLNLNGFKLSAFNSIVGIKNQDER